MVDKKISELTNKTRLGASDLLAGVDSGTNETINATFADSRKAIIETTAKTSNYTLTSNDEIVLFNCTSGNLIAYLPTASGLEGKTYTIKKTDSSSNKVTIDPSGSETIEGQSVYSLVQQYDLVALISNGSNWLILNSFLREDSADNAIYACDSGVNVNDCVYWDGSALQKSDKSNAATLPILAVVKAKPSSTTAQIQFNGERTGFSGITPNQRYYLGSNGGITSTVSNTEDDYVVNVGIGKNSSTIELRLSMLMVQN